MIKIVVNGNTVMIDDENGSNSFEKVIPIGKLTCDVRADFQASVIFDTPIYITGILGIGRIKSANFSETPFSFTDQEEINNSFNSLFPDLTVTGFVYDEDESYTSEFACKFSGEDGYIMPNYTKTFINDDNIADVFPFHETKVLELSTTSTPLIYQDSTLEYILFVRYIEKNSILALNSFDATKDLDGFGINIQISN